MEKMPIPFAPDARREANRLKPTPDGWSGAECLFCCKPIRDDSKAVHVHMLTSLELVPAGVEVPEDGFQSEGYEGDLSQGLWPVGPECARKVPARYRIKVQK